MTSNPFPATKENPILVSLDLLKAKNRQDFMESFPELHPTHKGKT